MKFCQNCGYSLSLGTEKFCPECGTALSSLVEPNKDVNKSTDHSGSKKNEYHFGNVGGSVTGVGVSGSGNIIGESVNISGTVSINNQQLQNVPSEYVNSLKSFSESINQQLKANNVPPEKVKPIQESINEFVKESEGIKPDQPIGVIKQSNLKSKLINIAKHVITVLPKTTETIAAFTPLAPFSKLIGEATERLVEAVQKEV